jgi:hypothetical protein
MRQSSFDCCNNLLLTAYAVQSHTPHVTRLGAFHSEVAMRSLLGLLLTAILVAATSVSAHHSFAATYDATKMVTLNGTVTKVEFRNPHIWVFLDVAGDNGGGATNWGCEGGAPNQLFRQGWRPDTLKTGDKVTIEGFASRDGKPVCNLRVLTRAADGRRVFAGQANDGAPTVPGQPGGAR